VASVSTPLSSASSATAPIPGARSGLLTHGALVALVGGALTVQSQPDVGTTVTIRVPRTRAEHEIEQTAKAARPGGVAPTPDPTDLPPASPLTELAASEPAPADNR
jgi:hypothetical protein